MTHRKHILTGRTIEHPKPRRDDYEGWKNSPAGSRNEKAAKAAAKRELQRRKDEDESESKLPEWQRKSKQKPG